MKIVFQVIGLSALLFSETVSANIFKIGDETKNSGALELKGSITGRYIYKIFDDEKKEGKNNGSIGFSNLKMRLNYENPKINVYIDARCYQNKQFCDKLLVKEAWAAYKINDKNKITLGQQNVDFGFGSSWGTSHHGSLFYEAALDNVQRLGVKYQLNADTNHFTLGFYPHAGGSNIGNSKHARYYSGTFVQAENVNKGTNTREKNIIVGRISKDIHFNKDKDFKTEIGASYWHSSLDNLKTNRTGKRNAWSIFSTTDYQNWQFLALFGQQKINNEDNIQPNETTLGASDKNWQLANDGKILMTELNYTFNQPFENIKKITPYISFSKFLKDNPKYLDSQRLNIGLVFPYKNITLKGEYVVAKNDYSVGGSNKALAKGDNNNLNKLIFISAEYNF